MNSVIWIMLGYALCAEKTEFHIFHLLTLMNSQKLKIYRRDAENAETKA
jgi:hypothetical protein